MGCDGARLSFVDDLRAARPPSPHLELELRAQGRE